MWNWVQRTVQSEHNWVEAQLSAYLDGELTSKERARVEKHLASCAVCTAWLRTLRWTVSLVAEMPTVRAPRSFLITTPAPRPTAQWNTAYLYLRGATAAVAALLLIALVGQWLLPPTLPAAHPVPLAALPAEAPAAVSQQVMEREAKAAVVEAPVAAEAIPPTQTEAEAQAPAELPAPTLAPPSPLPPVEEARARVAVPPPFPLGAGADRGPLPEMGGRGGEPLPKTAWEEGRGAAMEVLPLTPLPLAQEAIVAVTSTPLPQPTAPMREVVTRAPRLPLVRKEGGPAEIRPTPFPPAEMAREETPLPWQPMLRLAQGGLAVLLVVLLGSTLAVKRRGRR